MCTCQKYKLSCALRHSLFHDHMRRFTINLRSCIKRVTRRDDSQSSDVWWREETRSLSSDA